MYRPACIEIDLTALRSNFNRVRDYVGPIRILAVLKANAYGHGLTRVAQALDLADGFGVACMEEAMALRQAGIKQKIVILEGFFTKEELDLLSEYQIDTVIHNQQQLALLTQKKLPCPITVWLKINTGLNRLGFSSQEVSTAWETLKACPSIKQLHLITHFASADQCQQTTTIEQIGRFKAMTASFVAERSLANSAAILAWPQTYADWVRPGLMLYGVSPFSNTTGADYGLQPVMTLKSRIIAIQQLYKGDTVGYHGHWVVNEPTMRIGIAALGYGDGYPHNPIHHASLPVLINGKQAHSIGYVSMDMVAINLNQQPEANIGDEVTFWGKGLAIEKVTQGIKRSVYELLCGVNHEQSLRLQVKDIKPLDSL